MDQVVNDRARAPKHLERVAAALGAGIILLDSSGQIAWVDRRTRARLNGGIENLVSTLRTLEPSDAITCSIYPAEVTINGDAAIVCVVREIEDRTEEGFDTIAALEAAMADPSWFIRTIVAKLKALRQVKRHAPASDLKLLTDRECEVLALICEGRSDAEMGSILKLSQNTVRNHIASLYRKIGVNRRTTAIIWAQERGLTPQELRARRVGRARENPLQK